MFKFAFYCWLIKIVNAKMVYGTQRIIILLIDELNNECFIMYVFKLSYLFH